MGIINLSIYRRGTLMINEELKKIHHQYKNDIQIYKEVLTETLKHQLVKTLKENESELFNRMKYICAKGEQSLTIYFVPEHIYKHTFVFEDDHAKFSLEHCIHEFVYENKLFGRKQVEFTDINFKKFYENLWSKVNITELKVINEILNDNPSITTNLKSYFENVGLSFNIRSHEYFLVIDLSF
jgi:hypothetical protein